jgi:PAS domain S-box-containing protein
VGLTVFALTRGYGVAHSAQEGLVIAAIAALATGLGSRKRAAACLVSLGLLTSSAILVQVWGGAIEAHFHFFVVIVLISLYEDWVPFLLAAAYVVVHDGVLAALDPGFVYNHPAAIADPWKWAAIHGVFVTAAGLASVVALRLNEEFRVRAREAYERAKRSEERFRGLLETAPDAMVIVDDAGRIALVNAQTEKLLGYTREDLFGREVEVLVPDRFRAGHVRRRNRFLAQPTTRPMGAGLELYALRKDGSELPVEISLSPLETEEGTLVSAAVRDVTERRRAEEMSRRLASIVEYSGDAILVKGPEGIVMEWNRGAERLFGYTAEEAIGKSVNLLIPPELADEEREILRCVFAGVAVEHYETVRLRKDGSRIDISLLVSPIRARDGAVVAASSIARDITERKRADRELARSNEELEQFAYVASHDLSEPLRVIGGFVQLLQRRYEGQLDADADRFIGATVSGVQRMQARIDALLAYSRVGRGEIEPEPVDCSEVLREAIASLRALLDETDGEITSEDLPTVRGSAVLLTHLLQNLLSNALKFADGAPPRVAVSAERLDGEWRFSVTDNGPGIEPRHSERIFRLFQRLHGREHAGTGIGLALCKQIVERHGGRIWVEPAEEGGSVFRFTLPD